MEGVVAGDVDQHVVRQDGGVEELKEAVLGGFDGGDIAGQSDKHLAQFLARLSKQPPVFGVSRAIFGVTLGIALRFDPLKNPLVDRRVAFAHLVSGEAE